MGEAGRWVVEEVEELTVYIFPIKCALCFTKVGTSLGRTPSTVLAVCNPCKADIMAPPCDCNTVGFCAICERQAEWEELKEMAR